MKILGLIVIGLILVVLLVGYCLWPLHDGSGSAPDNVLATRPSTERAITSPETNPAHPGTVVSPKPPGKTPPSSGIPSQEDRIAKDWKMREETADRANVPIAFYGKVVDQNGEVVKGVTVKMHIRTETALGPPEGRIYRQRRMRRECSRYPMNVGRFCLWSRLKRKGTNLRRMNVRLTTLVCLALGKGAVRTIRLSFVYGRCGGRSI